MLQYERQTNLADIWTVHSEEFEKQHGYPKNELGRHPQDATAVYEARHEK